ncbi:MAG TPA: TonB-dependent receptor [bacterium]
MRSTVARLLCCLFWIGAEGAPAGTVHGFVREKTGREPVVMANVWIRDTAIGTTTNLKGYYVLSSLPAGTYAFCFRYVGFKTVVVEKTVGPQDDIVLDVLLEVEPVRMKPTVIQAQKGKRKLDIVPGQIAVQAPMLREIPQVAEPDLFRAVQMLPGVATLSDFSAGLYIRGGSADQNLILLDQIDVYNPNHMFGFFSTFNTDAVKSVELLKGGFPAQYGGRLTSVLNVINKEGNRETFGGVARLSLLSSSATLEGPWSGGSWMVSGRRTYLDLAAKLVDIDLPYYFYDGHARVNVDIDGNNQASLSFYAGNDNLDLSREGSSILLDWGNKTFSAQWTHLFSSRMFSHFVLAGSRFDSDSRVLFDDVSFGVQNTIKDLSAKGMLTYSPSSFHSMDFGFEAKRLHFKLNYEIVGLNYPNVFSGNYLALYVQDNVRLGAVHVLQTGLRLDHYTDGQYTRLAPRISIKRLLTEKTALTLSYGRYAQFLNLVQQEGLSFADMWFPVDASFQPGGADHVILGFSYDNESTFSVDIEGYYKKYDNLAEYRLYRGADESLDHMTAAQNFLSGTGSSYGMDVFLRNRAFGFEGWIGYSYGWTKKRVNGYNFGRDYFPTYDRRHTFTAIQDIRLGGKWRINLAFKYGSGQPYTEATARYADVTPDGKIVYRVLDGEKNAFRLPVYHRLDLGLFYQTRLFKLESELLFQIVNATNRKNVWFRHYDTTKNPAVQKDYTQLPFLPTVGVNVHF